MTKKILITGANGFIGSALKNHMLDNNHVVASGREELNLLDREKVAKVLQEEKFDIIIHTATYDAAPQFSTNNPDKVLEYNLRMFDNLAQCSDSYDAMLYFGSGSEHRREKPYGLSKYVMNQITQNKKNIYNLRLYSVYGLGTDWRYRFINNACAKAALKLPISIPKINKCDYLHIKDLCKIVEYYIANFEALPKTNDICSGNVLSPEEIVNIIKETISITGVKHHKTVSPSVSRSKSSQKDYYGDSNFVNSLSIDLTPTSDGIKELINFYSDNKPDAKQFVY
jgi:GDP-L-fucose synthase